MEPSSIEKVLEIDEHIGCAMSGMTADARTMIDHARVVAQVRIFDFFRKWKLLHA
jgi:20S proteasome subunit alpha 5